MERKRNEGEKDERRKKELVKWKEREKEKRERKRVKSRTWKERVMRQREKGNRKMDKSGKKD